jgi:adenosylhomocysteine nucleosidase
VVGLLVVIKEEKTMVGIIGAQEVEVALLRSRMAEARSVVLGGLTFYAGVLEGQAAVVVKSGVGKVNAAICAQLLMSVFKATALVNTGIAGAIAPGLQPMDLVVATELVYHDMDATDFGYKPTEIPEMAASSVFRTDPALVAAAEKAATAAAIPFRAGRVATGDQFVARAAAKERIRSVCNPLAVEMEGAAVAHAAFLAGVPVAVIRCISDNAEEGGKTAYLFNEQAAAEQAATVVAALVKSLG